MKNEKQYKIPEIKNFVNNLQQGVSLWDMLEEKQILDTETEKLCYPIGVNDEKKYYGNFKRLMHVLVAGGVGTGKSVFLRSLIISIMSQHSPNEVRFLLIDPKGTEFSVYKDQPHLLVNEIITDGEKAIRYLKWASEEMQRRYGLYQEMSRQGKYKMNIDAYNQAVEPEKRLQKIVIVIDEIAELLNVGGEEFADFFYMFSMKCAASGIYIVAATAVLNEEDYSSAYGVLPMRIAFKMTQEQSNLILKKGGAEDLNLQECIFKLVGVDTCIKVKTPYLDSEDELNFLAYIKENNEAIYDEGVAKLINEN